MWNFLIIASMSLTKFGSSSVPDLTKIVDKDFKAVKVVSSLPMELGVNKLWIDHNIDTYEFLGSVLRHRQHGRDLFSKMIDGVGAERMLL